MVYQHVYILCVIVYVLGFVQIEPAPVSNPYLGEVLALANKYTTERFDRSRPVLVNNSAY